MDFNSGKRTKESPTCFMQNEGLAEDFLRLGVAPLQLKRILHYVFSFEPFIFPGKGGKGESDRTSQ